VNEEIFGKREANNTVSEVTRRKIFDALRVDRVRWWGRLSETDFLARVFDLKAMTSFDRRFSTAEDDIWQHRERNSDWDDGWVYADGRFDLLHCEDDRFLQFLCEMIHPVVRPDEDEVEGLLALFNDNLAADGWEIAERTRLSGKPVFAARRLLPASSQALDAAKGTVAALGSNRISQQITRMEKAIQEDPELAIGTAKELVETICKTILDECDAEYRAKADMPELVSLTLKQLQLLPKDLPARTKTDEALRRAMQSLTSVAQALAELRNLQGTGHGKPAAYRGLRSCHARLAVNAASAVVVFLFEIHQAQEDASEDDE